MVFTASLTPIRAAVGLALAGQGAHLVALEAAEADRLALALALLAVKDSAL